MITHSTRIENNVFKVTFNFTPKDVVCSRGNYTATHKGAGTSSRQGIWEGIEIVEVQTKVGNQAWVKHGKSSSVTVSTSDNGVAIQACAKYQLRTMGYHYQCTNGTIPFFYYGNIDGNPSKYMGGYFTDGYPASPGAQLHSIHAIVPKDWKHTSTQWSNWAYIHAKNTSNWQIDYGNYEQRNGSYEGATSSNGWISDSGYAQAWRKSCMFFFQKDYYSSSITSSGIVKDAKTPEIIVTPTKGSSGLVTLKYSDSNGATGQFKLTAYCNQKEANIETFETSSSYKNGGSKTYSIDFYKVFGESYEGNDVTYEAWVKNNYNKISPSTGKKGGHRFNGKPSIPNGLFVEGQDGIIYNNITFSWNASNDPDQDSVIYYPYLKTINKDGIIIRDKQLDSTNNNYLNYSIANDPDGCKYIFKVKAGDGLLTSDWSTELNFNKGAKPTGTIRLISPLVDNTNLYSDNPRFVFEGFDQKSTFVVNINGKEFFNDKDAHLFTSEGNKIMFYYNIELITSIRIYAYLKNEYGSSEKSAIYSFNRVNTKDNITEGNIAEAIVIKEIQKQIKDKANAYGLKAEFTEIIPRETYISSSIYNECYEVLNTINNNINSIINTDTFDTQMISFEIASDNIHDDQLWKNLIQDIKKI